MRFGPVSLLVTLGMLGISGCGSGGGALNSNGAPQEEGAYQPIPSMDGLPPALNPSTYDMPKTTYETPPGQTNAGGVGTGATLESACSDICTQALALDCPDTSANPVPAADGTGGTGGGNNGNNGNSGNGNGGGNGNATPSQASSTGVNSGDFADCSSACVQAFSQVPCPDQFAAALACLFDHVKLTCDLFDAASGSNTDAAQADLEKQLQVDCYGPLQDYASCAGLSLDQSSQQSGASSCVPGSQACDGCGGECDYCKCVYGDRNPTLCAGMC
jgi:hypothetical protein